MTKQTKNIKNPELLKQIGNELGLKIKTSFILLNLSRQIVIDRLEKTSININKTIKALKKEKNMLNIELENVYVCPLCGGIGFQTTLEYYREDGHVTTVKHVNNCPLCRGTGKISE
mgnify:CR=1 FL=1